ncbi:MAG: DUF4149 domain-containing protein [Desulfobacterales bacterium]|nr:MAG: DUF4149 domain-containing protein [Desulfobacterales bacterium]
MPRKNKKTRVCQRLLIFLALIWLGMVLGISFLEAPVKFRAPTLTRSVGLDVGRHVFGFFNKVEIALGVITLGLLLMIRPSWPTVIPYTAVWVIVILQSFWLMPFLDARTDLILQGQTPEKSNLHAVYVVLEVLKAGLLGYFGFRHIRPFKPNGRDNI